MLLLLLLTIAAITFANIRSVISENRLRQLEQNQEIAELLTNTRFPLTSSVLESMKSLSGADFVVVDRAGEIFGKTSAAPTESKWLQLDDSQIQQANAADQITANKVIVGGIAFYHSIVRTRQEFNRFSPEGYVHVFVPRQTEASIWWDASKSPLLIAAFVLPLACLIGLAFASYVTQPLVTLKQQVDRIAEGKTYEIPPVNRDDEIRDLNLAVNQMAAKLNIHDEQLRQNERLRTMVQIGSGVAHNLRNSATGCQLAVELLGMENQGVSKSENYQVAIRQIGLMNTYIKKFLLLSKSPGDDRIDLIRDIDLDKTLERVEFLLQPSAKHLGVELTVTTDGSHSIFRMTEEDAEQLMMNLISNAITAASSIGSQTNSRDESQGNHRSESDDLVQEIRQVAVELFENPANALTFRVTDNGPGPPDEIAQDLFQPFVTGSREGTGLGLWLVREIADRVNGTIGWQRVGRETVFTFEFGDPADSTGELQ